MTREDALALLDVFRLDCEEPPRPDVDRAARRFVDILARRHRRGLQGPAEPETGRGTSASRRHGQDRRQG